MRSALDSDLNFNGNSSVALWLLDRVQSSLLQLFPWKYKLACCLSSVEHEGNPVTETLVTVNRSKESQKKRRFISCPLIYCSRFDPLNSQWTADTGLRCIWGSILKPEVLRVVLSGCCSVSACCCWQPRLWATRMRPLWTPSGNSGRPRTIKNTMAW